MKRILFLTAIALLLTATSGCSNGLLSGGLIGGGNDCCGTTSNGLFGGGGILQSNFLKDGPVRQWLRGDACDSCNVPAGQITFDSGFDSSCESGNCGGFGVSSPVVTGFPPIDSAPVVSSPVTNYYPSHDQGVVVQPDSLNGFNGISESEFFGSTDDSLELPPLSGF